MTRAVVAQMRRVLHAIETSGLLTVRLEWNVWMIPVPARVTTVKTVNEDGFNPVEMRETIAVARCVILGFGKHKVPDIRWKGVGATYWEVQDDMDAVMALAEFDFDLREAIRAEEDA